MKNQYILILSSDDWGWKTSKYQLSTRFARENKVLFVSSVGFRSPTVSRQDLSRALIKLGGFFRGVRRVAPALFVLTPLVIPFRKYQCVALVNNLILKLQLRLAMRRLGIKEPYVFAFSQNWLGIVKWLSGKKTVYYCVDEHSAFKGIDAEKFRQSDREMAEFADLVICSSRKLQSHKKAWNARTYYLPHGVNYELFSRVVYDDALAVPADAKSLPDPVIGFFGHVSYDWVDCEFLKHLAGARPAWTILLIGKYSMDPDEFADFGNIRILGERDYRELPGYCKAFAVAIIPFVNSALTENCNPLKLYEYLSAGLPVVSTDIPEVRAYGDLVHIARSPEEFLTLCEKALVEGGKDMQEMRARVMAHSSWEDRVREIYRLVAG